ncbi:MAG: acyl-CoA thioesterase [Bacteroidetes bacterium]|nr:acyl-CoA thioesterase [Bacteroidota bacterium]
MLVNETKIRVRYGETDQMGFAYYGIYAQYFEVARVEALRKIGHSYKEMEEKGVMLPVLEFNVNYKAPAYYDDEITIVTKITEWPLSFKISFYHETYNASGKLLNTGKVTLISVDKQSSKPCRLPEWFTSALAPFFNE